MSKKKIDWSQIKKDADVRKKLIDTIEVKQSQAYDAGIEAAAMDKEGHVDYEKLEEEDNARTFAAEAGKVYEEAALKEFKSSGVTGPQRQLLQKAYSGATEGAILEGIRARGSGYTKGTHTGLVPEYMREVDETLTQAVYGQIGRKDIPEALKQAKADDFIDGKVVPLAVVRGLVQDAFERGQFASAKRVKGKHYAKKKAA